MDSPNKLDAENISKIFETKKDEEKSETIIQDCSIKTNSNDSDNHVVENENKNSNACSDEIKKEERLHIKNKMPKRSRRQTCNEEILEAAEKIPLNITIGKFNDSNNAKSKLKHYNQKFYNCISNQCERSLQDYQAHAVELLKFLSELWMNCSMCDLSLKIKEREYPAHKLALAVFSQKYRQEFQKSNRCDEGIYTIELQNTTDAALQSILKYIYNAEIDINPANADEIVNAAKELGIDNLMCVAGDYLNLLSISDILIFMLNVLDKDCSDLITHQTYVYIMKNLNKISRTQEYSRSSICCVKAILCDSYLQVDSETEVFDAAMRWINYDKIKRQKYLMDIMRCIRFTEMTPLELHHKTLEYPILQDNKELALQLLNAYKFHSFRNFRGALPSNFVKCEESRNTCLNCTKISENFLYALKEMAKLTLIIRSESKMDCFKITPNPFTCTNTVPCTEQVGKIKHCVRAVDNCCCSNLKSNSISSVNKKIFDHTKDIRNCGQEESNKKHVDVNKFDGLDLSSKNNHIRLCKTNSNDKNCNVFRSEYRCSRHVYEIHSEH